MNIVRVNIVYEASERVVVTKTQWKGVAAGRGGESLMDSEFHFCKVSVKAIDTGDSERPHACHRTLHVKMVLVNILILCILLQM